MGHGQAPTGGGGEPVPPGQDERSFRTLLWGTNIRARWLPRASKAVTTQRDLLSHCGEASQATSGRVFREGDLGRLSELYLHLNILVSFI